MSPKLSVFFIPQLWTDTLYGDLENAISLSWKCDQQFFFFLFQHEYWHYHLSAK